MFFAASDSDAEPETAVPGQLPRGLEFLRQQCFCELKVCYRQFISFAGDVQTKRDEFKCLPPHEKANFVAKSFHFRSKLLKLCGCSVIYSKFVCV